MKASFLAFLLVLPVAADPGPRGHITEEMDKWLMEGVDAIYRMEFDAAEAASRKAIALNPKHPHAYLGLAGVAWTRYVYGADQSDPGLLEPFEWRTKEAIAVAEAWLKEHPKDGPGLMCLGSAYGLSSRLSIIRKEWLKGYWHGRKAVAITRQAVKAEPELWDAYLGLGMYDYYTDVLPRFIGVLAKVVLRGDRLRGIETLRMVAEKGHYSRNNARILLVEIMTEDPLGARNPEKALEIMREFRARYPKSSIMHSAELVCLYESKLYAEAAEGAKEFIARARAGVYNPLEAAKGLVILGSALWASGDTEGALRHYREATEFKVKDRLSRWAVWALIRAGRLEDKLGRREDALKDYKTASAADDLWGLRAVAKGHMAKPFDGAHPGPIPPPY